MAFLGKGLVEMLRGGLKTRPELVRKKTILFLKFCRGFLCDSELALLAVKTFPGRFDDRSRQAVEDVIATHVKYSEILREVGELIKDEPLLAPTAGKAAQIGRQLESLHRAWLDGGFVRLQNALPGETAPSVPDSRAIAEVSSF